MSKRSVSQQERLEKINQEHEKLLKQYEDFFRKNSAPSENDIKFFVSSVISMLEEVAQAGAIIEDSEQRSRLRNLISYWSRMIIDKTENFPIYQLLPFNESRPKRTSRKPFFWVAVPMILVLLTGLIAGIVVVTNRAPRNPCLTMNPPHPLPSIEHYEIYQGVTYCTDPNKWTVVKGDVTYIDPNSGLPVFVKSANGAQASDPNVGSLLAVRGKVEIIGTNTASYDLYSGKTTTIEQIEGKLVEARSAIICSSKNKRCNYISVVIINDNDQPKKCILSVSSSVIPANWCP